MKKFLIVLILLGFMAVPVKAWELEAPPVPEQGLPFMPEEPDSLGSGLLELLQKALFALRPDLREAAGLCLSLTAAVMAVSMTEACRTQRAAGLAGTVCIGMLMLSSANSMIRLGADTVEALSEYGKLLIPVMTSALAAQGGLTASAGLYMGTVVFDTLLGRIIAGLMIPMIYFYLAAAAASAATGEAMLAGIKGVLKSVMVWTLRIILYTFTGYIGITGVISGTTDAAALKAARVTISGVVPVIGGILSDASEAVLVSAGLVKNAAGLYGIFSMLAIFIGPFLRIGTHCVMLNLTAAVCGIFGCREMTELIRDFSQVMALLLAMTGTVCLMLMFSTVCFMRGVG